MNKQMKSILKKTVKIAGVTCVAAGAVAVMTSGVALKAIAEGGKYLADTVKKIIREEDAPEAQKADTTASAKDFAPAEKAPAAEEVPATEEVAAEEV